MRRCHSRHVHSDERAAKYDFSEPYYDSGVGMAVLQGSDITTYDQLKGQNVAAKIGTKAARLLSPLLTSMVLR